MSCSRRNFFVQSGCMFAVVGVPRVALANAYPARAVHVVIPFAPGGPTDVAGRVIAQGLAQHFGQTFNVENLGGAGGNIGVGKAAHAAPDGYTLLVAAASYAINPSLFEKLPYNPAKDFSVVTFAATAPTALTVHPSVPCQSVTELIALIKASPGKFSYASPGPGTPPHLVGELFRLRFQLDLVHVPFNGGGPAVISTLAGHTPISFGALSPVVQHVKEGRLRALAITSKSRAAALPDVPTMADEGFPDIAADIWQAVLVPAGTPSDIVSQLHSAIIMVLGQEAIRERLSALGFVPVGTTPQESELEMRREIAKWAKVVRDAGIKLN